MLTPLEINTKAKEFIKPEHLLEMVGLEPGMTAADFGCGNGHYTVAAGALVGKKGQVYSLDIMEDALSQTAGLAKLVGLHNVITRQCDLEMPAASKLADGSCDLVVLSSLLHQVDNKPNVFREAYRILKTGGRVLLVEWGSDGLFGPPLRDRLPVEEAKKLLEQFSFRPLKELPAGSFHYALLYTK